MSFIAESFYRCSAHRKPRAYSSEYKLPWHDGCKNTSSFRTTDPITRRKI